MPERGCLFRRTGWEIYSVLGRANTFIFKTINSLSHLFWEGLQCLEMFFSTIWNCEWKQDEHVKYTNPDKLREWLWKQNVLHEWNFSHFELPKFCEMDYSHEVPEAPLALRPWANESESKWLLFFFLTPVNREIKIPRSRATKFVAPSIKAHST